MDTHRGGVAYADCPKKESLLLLSVSVWNSPGLMKTSDIIIALNSDSEAPIFKISSLGIIGDLYVLGVPLEGWVIAIRSGHDLNIELVKKLRTKEQT